MNKQFKVRWGIFSLAFKHKLEAFETARQLIREGHLVVVVDRDRWVQDTPVSGHVITTRIETFTQEA